MQQKSENKKTPRIPPRRFVISIKKFLFLNRCSLRWYEPNQVQRVSVYRTQSQLATTSPPTFFPYELFVIIITISIRK